MPEESLTEANEHCALLFKSITEGLAHYKAIYDNTGKLCDLLVLEINPAGAAQSGVKRENQIGKTWRQIWTDIPDSLFDIYRQVDQSGEPFSYEHFSPIAKRWYINSLYKIAKGQFAVTFFDITERKKAEEALRRSEELLAESQAIAHVGSWQLDIETNNLSWSDEVYRIFGLKPQEFNATYQAFLETIHPDDRKTVDSTYSNSVAQKKDGYEIEHRIIRKRSGEVRFVHEKGVHVKDASGKIVRSVGMVQDITERKEFERKLEDYSKNLERLVEERTRKLRDAERLATIGQVAGMVGHDIKNPLQAIISEVYLAKTEIDNMPKIAEVEAVKESIDSIEQQTSYIDKIVKDLQELARPLTPELVEVDLCQAVPQAFSTVKIPANIELTTICDFAELKATIDVTFLRRIMTNLVNNAIQAMPNGGKLTVRLLRKDDSTFVTVEDTGVGISKEAMGKLFAPLFTTKAKGQGFGLVTVKRMIEALGGSVTVESEVNKGTKFTLRFRH